MCFSNPELNLEDFKSFYLYRVDKIIKRLNTFYCAKDDKERESFFKLARLKCENIMNEKYFNEVYNFYRADLNIMDHSITTAILSMLIASKIDLSVNEIDVIFISALLHDIGLIEIFKKYETFGTDKNLIYTRKYKDIFELHPILGLSYITNNYPNFNMTIRKSILLHHIWEVPNKFEKVPLSFSSFPKLYKGNELDEEDKNDIIRIIQLANIYDSLTILDNQINDYNSRKTHDMIFFVNNFSKTFGYLFSIFFSYMSIYFIDEEIQLSNGDLCEVAIHNPNSSFYPILKSKNSLFSNAYIDFSQYKDIVFTEENNEYFNLRKNDELFIVDDHNVEERNRKKLKLTEGNE